MYISPHRPDALRRAANLKLYPLRQTPDVSNLTNFQLDPPLVLAPRGVEVGGFPLTFQTTHTTNSTNVLLVTIYNAPFSHITHAGENRLSDWKGRL